ncbi:MAG: EpsG family protein [Fibrobacter sp.]|nr:EpsG family protein [Fibrobacter sp.]
MTIYIVSFAISTLFFYIATTLQDVKQRWFMVLLAIVPVAFVAGVRDDCIGTDVLVYGKDCFLDAVQSRWYSEIDLSWMIRMEPGYLMLNYIVSRFTGNYHVFLGVLMAVQMFFVLKALMCFRNRMPIWIALAVYYLSYYNVSLNQMRQSLACAIVLYACTFAYKRKLIPFLLVVGIACFFHISALVAFLIYPVFIIFRKTQSYKLMWITVAMGIVMALLIQKTVDWVFAAIGLSSDYGHYFKDSAHGFFITKFLVALPIPALFFYLRKIFFRKETIYLAFSLIVMVIATQAEEIIGNDAERIMSYFVWTQIFALPFICAHLNRFQCKITGILGVGYYFCYWYYMFIYNGFQETYPYSSYILNQWL